MLKSLKATTIIAALLALSATASAQTTAPASGRTYVVRGVFYTAPVDERGGVARLIRPGVKVTNDHGRVTIPPVVENTAPLSAGVKGTQMFAEALMKLEAEGKVRVEQRPTGSIAEGHTLSLWTGQEIPVTVIGESNKTATTGYLLNGSRFSVRVKEVAEGSAYSLSVNAEMAEPSGGVVQLASIQTEITVRRGQTVVFRLGASPETGRQTFFAVGVEPVALDAWPAR